MIWKIELYKNNKLELLDNVSSCKCEWILNEFSKFTVVLSGFTNWQRDNIDEDDEIRIETNLFKLRGYIKKKSLTTQRQMTLEGLDYGIKLKNVVINADHTTQEDPDYSSGNRVQYTSKELATIEADILTGTGISAGTLTSYGNVTMRFHNSSVYNGLMECIKTNNYEWEVDENKKLNIISQIGSSSIVASLIAGDNCNIENYQFDTSALCKKCTVLGRGDGAEQISGTYTAGSYTFGDPEKIFLNKNIISTAEATSYAQNYVQEHQASVTYIDIKVWDIYLDLNLGDKIKLVDNFCDLTNDYRIVKVEKGFSVGAEFCNLELGNVGKKNRKKSLIEELKGTQELTVVSGSASQGQITELIFEGQANATQDNKLNVKFNIPSDVVKSDSDILSAKLYFTRHKVKYDTEDETATHLHADGTYGAVNHPHTTGTYTAENHPHSEGMFQVQNHPHSDGTYYATNHDHGAGSLVADYDNFGEQNAYGEYSSTPIIDGSWHDVGWYISTGSYLNMVGCWCLLSLGCDFGTTFKNVGIAYLRLHNMDTNENYPTNTGIILGYVGGKDKVLQSFYGYINCPEDWSGDDVVIQYLIWDEVYSYMFERGFRYNYFTSRKHSHDDLDGSSGSTQPDVTGSSGYTEPNLSGYSGYTQPDISGSSGSTSPDVEGNSESKTADINRGIYNPSGEVSQTINYYTNGTYRGNKTNVNVGYESDEIDLTSYITTTGYHYVELAPLGSIDISNLNAQIKIKVFEET